MTWGEIYCFAHFRISGTEDKVHEGFPNNPRDSPVGQMGNISWILDCVCCAQLSLWQQQSYPKIQIDCICILLGLDFYLPDILFDLPNLPTYSPTSLNQLAYNWDRAVSTFQVIWSQSKQESVMILTHQCVNNSRLNLRAFSIRS